MNKLIKLSTPIKIKKVVGALNEEAKRTERAMKLVYVSDEQASVSASYWLDASPHEQTKADGIILAKFARQALRNMEALREENEHYRKALHEIASVQSIFKTKYASKLAEEALRTIK